MLKPDKVRAILSDANPYLVNDPDKLQVFLDSGTVVSRGSGRNLSFEYRYTLTIIVQEFPHHANRVVLPLLALLRTEQPELFENPERAEQAIRFDAELLTNKTIDLALSVDLTERVIVQENDRGNLTAYVATEPIIAELPPVSRTLELFDRKSGDKLGEFSVPAWEPRFD